MLQHNPGASRRRSPENRVADALLSVDVSEPILVADVGGTHVRFALSCAPGRLDHVLDLTGPFVDFGQALGDYQEYCGLDRLPKRAVCAVAGPVLAGEVQFTNRNWRIREDDLKRLGIVHVRLINDFAALAWAAEEFGAADSRPIGPAVTGREDGAISIVGAGTGFGVSCLVRSARCAIVLSTEAGHAAFAPSDEREMAVLRLLQQRFGRVSIERLLSGPGLENLFAALEQKAGRPPRPLTAAQVVDGSKSGDFFCQEALALFCSIYGAVAGDIALAHGATGGVLIAGGIAQKIGAYLATSAFRAKFEDKGRLMPYMRAIPTRLICNPHAALLGAARVGHTSGLPFASTQPA